MTALLDTSKLIVGASGSGKTVTAKAEVAQLLDERRHVAIIDPTGVWWGMRSTPDGNGAGYDLPIFGGPHGDIAIRADQGRAIAQIIVEQRVSAIVDLSAIDNSADWRLFMDGFVSGLRKGVRGNFHLVVDEADEFAAERAADSFGFALRENLVWIAKRGRAQGFVPTWITQRPADIAKAVISQAQTIIAHQLILSHDQKAIDDYLKSKGSAEVRKDVMGSLAELAIGERWVYSPRLKLLERGTTPPLATYDSSRTPAPGERLVEPRTLAQLDVTAIAAALVPAASAELPDDTIPNDAGAAYKKGGAVASMILERDARIEELEATIAARDARIDTLEFVSHRALTLADGISRDMAKLLALITRDGANDQDPAQGENLHSYDAASSIPPDVQGLLAAFGSSRDGAIKVDGSPPQDKSDREYRALGALAAIYPAGLTEAAWATRSGYSRKGGAWNARRRRYVDAGLIEQNSGRWFATDAGVAAAGAETPTMPQPGPDLVRWWADRLGAAGRLLKHLADVHPRQVNREQLASLAGMTATGGAFSSRVAELKAAELITDNRKRLGLAPGLMGEA